MLTKTYCYTEAKGYNNAIVFTRPSTYIVEDRFL